MIIKSLLISTSVVLGLIMVIASCTSNQRARRWGGTEQVQLQKNEVLLSVTWKENNMWVLTRDTLTNVNHFREHSSYGVIEGEVMFE